MTVVWSKIIICSDLSFDFSASSTAASCQGIFVSGLTNIIVLFIYLQDSDFAINCHKRPTWRSWVWRVLIFSFSTSNPLKLYGDISHPRQICSSRTRWFKWKTFCNDLCLSGKLDLPFSKNAKLEFEFLPLLFQKIPKARVFLQHRVKSLTWSKTFLF